MGGKIENPVRVRAERPRPRRYPFVASIELVDLQSAVQFQGRVTDLNLYGCGVAASKPLPTGTTLRVRITSKGRTFWALGKVAYATADGDMGIAFARIERNDQVILEDWITEATRPLMSDIGFPTSMRKDISTTEIVRLYTKEKVAYRTIATRLRVSVELFAVDLKRRA